MSEKREFEYTQYIVVNSDVKEMKKGKLVAQGAHASIGAYRYAAACEPIIADDWFAEGQRKITVKATEQEILDIGHQLACHNADDPSNYIPNYTVRDFGLTQIPAGTLTCMAIGPARKDEIEKFVKHLKLL